ncbi:hypothetical protein LPB86_03345 [Pedobacter sp. MC2016-14]|uniref:DUF4998 domain-containing protein n=1 Tax=Pedobacter sp. MC2016-14 TaxID=2897327 RepID=UPI001E5DDEE3|nr:DUF4998 domain-containing protein [Pedobacter sp. MC2016-14]MCD0487247.1 hypothetical protein [Pedobacter sp. MC2016-14]
MFIIGCFLFALMLSCEKEQTDFRNFFDGKEIVYTGSVGKVVSKPGNLRTLLKWKSSTDPSIVKYVVFYNKTDSQVVNITAKTDSVSALIENLQEFVYAFTIYSYDAKGNKSIPTIVNNVKIYGPTYRAGLLNRAYDAEEPYTRDDNGVFTLNFNAPDTINVNTVVRYTNTSGATVEKILLPTASSLTLADLKEGTEIFYRSSYIPGQGSLDVFTVQEFSAYPPYVYKDVMCKKSLFSAAPLPNDAYADYGTSIEKLWDGTVSPQGYPNIFHTNNGSYPHVFTIDMGRTYKQLTYMEETGRDCCHNPIKFEIWGSNTLTATNLRADENGWAAESVAKGWTLLKEVTRNDDGSSALKISLMPNPPAVRYIRIRVLTTATGNTASNISELTFWNYQ